jgi:hypothetical protein
MMKADPGIRLNVQITHPFSIVLRTNNLYLPGACAIASATARRQGSEEFSDCLRYAKMKFDARPEWR